MNYRIKTFGWRNPPLDQITRIEEGLTNLGHEIIQEGECDLIYKNNDFFEDAWQYYDKCDKKPFTIFNILDLQLETWDRNQIEKLNDDLNSCDQVTCISETVKRDIREIFSIEAINIGNPIKDISYIPEIKKEIDFTVIGRNSDLNKRTNIFEDLLLLPECENRTYCSVGSEPPRRIKDGWLGILNDKELNDIYNMTKYVICCSKREGLNLVIAESCVAGAIPLIASDMTVCKEWNMPEFVVDSNAKSVYNKIQEIEKEGYEKYQQIALNYGKIWAQKFNKNQIAKNILSIYENKTRI